MAKYRIVQASFWKNPITLEEMTPEDKYFYVYLLTNPLTTQIGIYQISKKEIAFDMGYSIEMINELMKRFIEQHKLIRYNPETRELAIKYWGKDNLDKGGKPVMDCIMSELKEVQDLSLIQYVAESIHKQDIRSLYEYFYKQDEMSFSEEHSEPVENDTYLTECDDSLLDRHTNGQKVNNPEEETLLERNEKTEDVKEIIAFWDNNGFGFSNLNAKEQLLAWLEDSNFSQPKEMILKAMNIACANNKRKLNYIVGILKNWENESLLTVEEIDSYENQKSEHKSRPLPESTPVGRVIPSGFTLDLTAGEER